MKNVIYLIFLLLIRGSFYAGTCAIIYYTLVVAVGCQNHKQGIFIAISGGALSFTWDLVTRMFEELIKAIYDRGDEE